MRFRSGRAGRASAARNIAAVPGVHAVMTSFVRTFAVACCVALLGAGPAPRVVDLMPAYWAAWDANPPGAARAHAIATAVVAAHPEVYGAEFASLRDPASLERYLARVAPDAAAVRAASSAVPLELPADIAQIRSALPDFALEGITIYVVPSFGHYNGRVRPVAGGLALFLGPDGMVQGEGAQPNIARTVVHELFHIYQFQMHPEMDPSAATLWMAAIGEGQAVYASQVITGASTDDALMSAEYHSPSVATTKALACGIRDRADSRNPADFETYLTGGVHPPNLPDRGAYYIGYLIVHDLGKRYTLSQMAKLSIAAAEPQVRSRLDQLCTTGTLAAS